MKRNPKNHLDEMQEMQLLEIEHNACWLCFWLLLIAMAVQGIAFGNGDLKIVAGEWVVFTILGLYLGIACIRRGIWDRRIPMNTKTNLIISLIASLAAGVFNFSAIYINYQMPGGAMAAACVSAVLVFVLCAGALALAMKTTKRINDRLETEPDDPEE